MSNAGYADVRKGGSPERMGFDVPDARSILKSMDLLSDTIFFLKDRERKYHAANRELGRLYGINDQREIIGRRTTDFFDLDVVSRYDELDLQVRKGFTLLDRFDQTIDHKGDPVWCLYSRTLCRPENGDDPLILGLSRRLPRFRGSDCVYERLWICTELIVSSLDCQPKLSDLADQCSCSTSQLERDFARVLSTTPIRYSSLQRIQLAKDKIRAGESLVNVALDCGFPDQSALSRRFKAVTGLTPSRYRANLRVES